MSDFVVRIDDLPLRDLFRKFPEQFRNIGAIAINRTVELGLAEARKVVQANMVVRVPRFILPPIQLPNVARAKPNRLIAEADVGYSDGPDSIGGRRQRILRKFEEGRFQTARDPINYPFAIPTKSIRPTPQTLVARRLYPRQLTGIFDAQGNMTALGRFARSKTRLKHDKATGLTKVYRKQVGRYFVLGKPGEKAYGVYERFGPGKHDTRMMWAFRQGIPIPKRLFFRQTITSTVNAAFPGEFSSAWNKLFKP